MQSQFVFAIILVAFMVSTLDATQLPEDQGSKVVNLLTDIGIKRLEDCKEKKDYIRLTCYFECQLNPSYCGPASIAMTANALQILRPKATQHPRYRLFSQTNVFDSEFSPPISASIVRKSGMTLKSLSSHLKNLGCNTTTVYASDATPEEFRSIAINTLSQDGAYIIANYDRAVLGQDGSGHFSPIAAYNSEHDEFLVLDVAHYKYGPVWVKANLMHKAMATLDGKCTRGCVVVREPNQSLPSKE